MCMFSFQLNLTVVNLKLVAEYEKNKSIKIVLLFKKKQCKLIEV